MKWEELTSPDFARAVEEAKGVCVLAMGVLEKHGDHLPLGTDYMNSQRICAMAAEREAAVVFPPWYFGQIYEAKHFPGCLTISPTVMLQLFDEVFSEIARNGLRKIVLYIGHGGNNALAPFLAQAQLSRRRNYLVYVKKDRLNEERRKKWKGIIETDEHGHACECETSISLANHAHLVRMDAVPSEPATALKRLKVPNSYTAVSWYANYPEHYAGDARAATAEKGEKLRELVVEDLVEFVRAVKEDEVGPTLLEEFYGRVAGQ